jgi:hypothetical protein
MLPGNLFCQQEIIIANSKCDSIIKPKKYQNGSRKFVMHFRSRERSGTLFYEERRISKIYSGKKSIKRSLCRHGGNDF